MFGTIFKLNKFHMLTVISLLLLALFFSYYNVNSGIDVYKKSSENSRKEGRLSNTGAMDKTGGNTNKLRFANLRIAETEKEKLLSEKKLGDDHQSSLGRKWMFYYFYIFNILFLSTFILYNKGWFIKVIRSKYQIFQVHYIQSKDGKKNALSCCHSF